MTIREQAHKRHVRILADAAHIAVEDARKRFPRHITDIRFAIFATPITQPVIDESWHYRDEQSKAPTPQGIGASPSNRKDSTHG